MLKVFLKEIDSNIPGCARDLAKELFNASSGLRPFIPRCPGVFQFIDCTLKKTRVLTAEAFDEIE